MGFDRQQQMMNHMPYNSASGGNFTGDMPIDRMGGPAEMMGRMPRSGIERAPNSNSDMMMMINNNGGMDMMQMGRNGNATQDMMRNSAFDRMSRGPGQGMGAPDMMGMRMGMMGGQGDRQLPFMGEHAGQGPNVGGGNYDSQDGSKDIAKNDQTNV